jgi:Cdc6-like AAA superfamily ATPase
LTSNKLGTNRKNFRGRLDHILHPSRHIELREQLKGREKALNEMLDAFETPGAHPFIWGSRGIGKTSVGHTACTVYDDEVELCAVVACSPETSFRTLIQDIVNACAANRPALLKNAKIKAQFKVLGLTLSGETGDLLYVSENLSPNQAASIMTQVVTPQDIDKAPCIIIDEFDRLSEDKTFQSIADMLKQMSVTNSPVKIIFCGVTRDLDDLLSAHESVDRYVQGVELKPLSHDAVWEIVDDVENEFAVRFHRGQRVRISQISCGYPHFAHLILKYSLLKMFEDEICAEEVDTSVFDAALKTSAEKAATRLRTAYESAIRKGTDRYIEVMFALANGPHLNRQFKDIAEDYKRIIESRPHRSGYDVDVNNGQDLRNALESLTKRKFLRKGKSGWYEFEDPMLRGYVRLVAEQEGVELGDSVFPR